MGVLIDKQVAIDVINEECDHLEKMGGGFAFAQGLRSAIPTLDTIPTAEPERKTGRWIIFDSDKEKYDDIKCSNCKMNFTVDAYRWCDIGFTVDDLKYCPNCGAYMIGEQDG